jgi:DNA-binding transcriptional ArsR family regulator
MNLNPSENPLVLFTQQDPQAPENAARFLKSLAHRDRLKLLCCLMDQELTVGEIEAQVGASQSAISQHLGRLKDEGILTSRRNGRQVLYAIADPTVLALIEVLYQRFCAPDADGASA